MLGVATRHSSSLPKTPIADAIFLLSVVAGIPAKASPVSRCQLCADTSLALLPSGGAIVFRDLFEDLTLHGECTSLQHVRGQHDAGAAERDCAESGSETVVKITS